MRPRETANSSLVIGIDTLRTTARHRKRLETAIAGGFDMKVPLTPRTGHATALPLHSQFEIRLHGISIDPNKSRKLIGEYASPDSCVVLGKIGFLLQTFAPQPL